MKTVYIASPYSEGDIAVNVKRQIDAASDLIGYGLVPYAPLLSHFLHIVHPQPYEKWLEVDLEWVKRCDIFLRLEGKSKGADIELQLAKSLNKKIYYNLG